MSDTSKFSVDGASELLAGEADLDQAGHTWPDGRPLTEESTTEYTEQRKASGGRPSLSGVGLSPSVAFRLTPKLRSEAAAIARSEGRPVSAVAREALEDYIRRHRAS